MNLDLGAGKIRKKDWIPIDIVDFGDNVVIDIEKDGLKKYENESIDHLRAYAFLEHVRQDKIIFVMNECWRILKEGGTFDILVPNAEWPQSSFSDPTHISTWHSDTFTKYFTGKEPKDASYNIMPWKIEKGEIFKKTLHYKLKKMRTVRVIVFSFNRAMQLHLLLESIEKFATDFFDEVIVTYNYSNNKFKEGYEWLIHEGFADGWYPQKDTINSPEFKNFLLDLMLEDYTHTCFLCDDSIIYKEINKNILSLIKEDIVCFSLRMGLNIKNCYTMNCKNELNDYEDLGDCIKWNWKENKADFGYPLSIDGHLYETKNIINMINKIRFISPPKLEGALQSIKESVSNSMLSYKESRLISNPINKVQIDYPDNKVGEAYPMSVEKLNNLYLNDKVIDLDKLDFSNIDSPHKEIDLVFKEFK